MIKTQTVLKVLIGIGLALALLAGGWLLGSRLWGATCGGYGRGMMNGYGSPWGMHTLGGGILMFLFWLVIVGGIALLVAGLARQGAGATGQGQSLRSEAPLEILRRRYAAGEIDREEFERMKELLSA